LATEKLFAGGRNAPIVFLIWPPFAFYRAVQLINLASYDPNLRPFSLSDIVYGTEIFTCLLALSIEIVILFVVSYYLEAVLPSEFGVKLYFIDRFQRLGISPSNQ
jgi:hypothetical protein